MSIYAYPEAIRNFAGLLEEAFESGEVRIRRNDGQVFVLKPEAKADSPLDVAGIDLGVTTAEILQCLHESRRK